MLIDSFMWTKDNCSRLHYWTYSVYTKFFKMQIFFRIFFDKIFQLNKNPIAHFMRNLRNPALWGFTLLILVYTKFFKMQIFFQVFFDKVFSWKINNDDTISVELDWEKLKFKKYISLSIRMADISFFTFS